MAPGGVVANLARNEPEMARHPGFSPGQARALIGRAPSCALEPGEARELPAPSCAVAP